MFQAFASVAFASRNETQELLRLEQANVLAPRFAFLLETGSPRADIKEPEWTQKL